MNGTELKRCVLCGTADATTYWAHKGVFYCSTCLLERENQIKKELTEIRTRSVATDGNYKKVWQMLDTNTGDFSLWETEEEAENEAVRLAREEYFCEDYNDNIVLKDQYSGWFASVDHTPKTDQFFTFHNLNAKGMLDNYEIEECCIGRSLAEDRKGR